MAKSKQDLDVAIQKMDFKTVLELSVQNRNKKNPFSFFEHFKKKKEHEITKTVSGLTRLLMSCIEKYLAENGKSNWTKANVENRSVVSQVILGVVDIALVSVQLKISNHCQVELALMLNGILPEIPSSEDSAKNCIAQYCEKLFATSTFDKSEYYLYNVLAYLLQRTLATKATKTDVKRIYNIRKMFGPIMEMKESRHEELWDLFMKCTINPIYLSTLEGQKVLGLIMALDIDKVSDLHQIITDHLPTINVKIAVAYGRVYFEAWCYCIKIGKRDVKNVLEITCLQDFLLLAVCSKHRPFLPLVRKLLSQFHSNKKESEVSKMLYSLYQPILWRFLKNPDGQVRANAALLFLDIFPLEDPDENIVTAQLELNDQLLMIKDLLLDDFPIVRITAVLGICISMSVNWEVFPEEMLKTYFRILVDDLSRDSSSAEVRCAVVKGIICLLENPLTIKCLGSILPKLRGMFHDTSENVRIAFCQLLLKIKKISGIKYFDIVPVKHLFARLEEDCHAVKKSITSLLSNSYFPRDEDPKIWLGRCIEIIKNERGAARVFFTYVGQYIGLENAIKFMIQAVKAVHLYVKTKQSSAHNEFSNKENIINYEEYIASLERAVGFNDHNIVGALMDAVAVMWLSLKMDMEKPENKDCLKMVVQKLGKPLADLCLYYKDTEALESVFYISSYLPAHLVPSLASLCFWRLKNLRLDAKPEQYEILLECLCNQDQGIELLHLLKEWIEAGLTDSYVEPPAKRQRRARRKKNDRPYYDQPKPYLANKMLQSILAHRALQKAILMHPQSLKEMLYLIEPLKWKLEGLSVRLINEVEASFLSLLMYNIVRISVFLHDDSLSGGIQFVNEVVEWADQKLLKHLVFLPLETNDHFSTLVVTICKNLCQVMSDITGLGFIDPNSRMYLLFFEKLLHSGMGYKYALITARFLYKHAVSGHFSYVMENDAVMLCHLLESLPRMIDCFCNDVILESIPPQELKEIQFTLASLMQVLHNHIARLSEPTSLVFKCILKNIVHSIQAKSSVIVENLSEDKFADLTFPNIGAFFMAILTLKPALLSTYLKFLNEFYTSSEKEISFWIACWTIIYSVLDMKTSNKSTLSESNVLVRNLEKTIHEIYPRKKEQTTTSDTMETVPVQMFQRHCHAEFAKLKSRLSSKVSALRSPQNQTEAH